MKSLLAISRRVVMTLAMLAFAGSAASAAQPLDLTAGQRAAVDGISKYLNSFKTLQGEFTQISPKGNQSQGVFYISKPGKMRFEYAPPNPYLIVADGTWLTVKNVKKEKGDQFPLSQTPLRLVLSNKVDIANDTHVLDYQEQDGIVSVTIEDKKNTLANGQLTLVFDSVRNQLQQWVVIDGKGRRTTVSLENIEAGINPDPKLFVVKIDRADKHKSSP